MTGRCSRLICAALAVGVALSTGYSSFASHEAFEKHWRDGKAELSGYQMVLMRYGKKRKAELVLVYVTEAMDRRVWVKDDAGNLPAKHRADVLKLNAMLKFKTGIYPYSVMTSTFSLVGTRGPHPFPPVKIAFSAQEWCGHVYQQLRPQVGKLSSVIHSYFGSEGDQKQTLRVPTDVLYGDGLLIQLRELKKPFNAGRDWSGRFVPTLWEQRKSHRPLRVVAATIKRQSARRGERPVNRFALRYEGRSVDIDIEEAYPHRVLGWKTSDGESASILKTARLPYWQLNDVGNERYRKRLGLAP